MGELPNNLERVPAGNGFSLVFKGKSLLSRVDPAAQGERLASSFPLKERTLYVCPSPLFGYGLARLLERLPLNSAILCLEAEDELLALSREAFAALPGAPRLVQIGENENEGARVCAYARAAWGTRAFRRVETLRLSSGWQLHRDLYEKITRDLEADMAIAWENAMTLIRLGRPYARNAIRNLPLLPSSRGFRGASFGDTPVLALGAGPSLDAVLNRLPRERNFRIICADSAVPCLKDRGIRPDLVVILESQFWNLGDFTGARGWGAPAAADLSAFPASAAVLGGPLFLFFTPWTSLRLFARLEEAGLLPPRCEPLGSVGLAAVDIARRLTAGPVVTAGLDFSFTADRYHARSSPGHKRRLASLTRLGSPLNAAAAYRPGTFAAEAVTGEAVRSDPALRRYRDMFEREFGGDGRIYAIEGPGLPLGVKTVSMDKAIKILTTNDTNSANKIITTPSFFVRDVCEVRGFISSEIDRLIKLRGILTGDTAADDIDTLLDECDYLWAHFPECAASDTRPPSSDLSFLKRVRAEIDPFLRCWELSIRLLP